MRGANFFTLVSTKEELLLGYFEGWYFVAIILCFAVFCSTISEMYEGAQVDFKYSGTPIQLSVKGLGQLVRFIEVLFHTF